MNHVEEIVTKAYRAIKNNYSIALPAVISWVPTALIFLVFADIFKNIVSTYSLDILRESEPSTILSLITVLIKPYAVALLILFLLSIIADYYIKAIYPFIAKSINSGKQVNLSEALSNAKGRILALFATDILFIILIILGFGAVFGLVGAISIILGGIGLLIGIIGGMLFFFWALLYLVPIGIVLNSIVVLERKSGIGALESAYALIKSRKLDSWIFTIIVGIIVGIYTYLISILESALSYVMGPYSSLLAIVLAIFSTAFLYICQTLFYFELNPKPFIKKEIPPRING